MGVRESDAVAAPRVQTRTGRWWSTHPGLLRTLAVLALAWNAAYLTWRIGWSWHGVNPVLFGMLLLGELYGAWSLCTLTWYSWTDRRIQRPYPTPGRAVDVYVCTYDEPESVLEPTLLGCQRMTYPHVTYLLDDGRRPEMAELAARYGARYLTRPDNSHAKAGNINHALHRTDGDLVFILDADHVPLPDALDALVGYFDDTTVALVQTPHDFFNHDSAQHYEPGRHEQSVFYSAICPGKDRHNAAFWCGSAALLRRDALLDVGGVATETIAEDFHTTIKMHQRGWSTRYHEETLVQGLAPHDLSAYLLQRDRWARGNLAVFTTPQSPLRARELTLRQRLSYFISLAAYLAGPVRALMMIVLGLTLWTGALPMRAAWLQLIVLWAPTTLLNLVAGSALCKGYMRLRETFHFELTCAEIHLRALRCVVRPGRMRFKVTPKEGVDPGGLTALRQLRLVVVITALMLIGLFARAFHDLGWLPMPELPGVARVVVPMVAAVEVRRMVRSLVVHYRRHQVRALFRFPCTETAMVTGYGTTVGAGVVDLNPTGASLRLPRMVPAGTRITVGLTLPDAAGESHRIRLTAKVLSNFASGDGFRVGVRFTELAPRTRGILVEYCFLVTSIRRLRPEVAGRPPVRRRPVEVALLPRDLPVVTDLGVVAPG